ncbi:unnamed protein product [Gongylonema pulchrum]|uniref:MARVEL domain-containing protein n=1 Tax=Gongylonema pulchrum TaxID=637853 RepID=A0A183CUC6_9BILA|nr:unnamed protein product [Gongylonema pulchrum]
MNNSSSFSGGREAQVPNGVIARSTPAKTSQRRCCCNSLHVVTATLLIGCLELCYFAYEVFSTIYHFMRTGEQYILSLSVSLFCVLLALVAVLLLFAAVKTSTAYLLVPHLLMQAAAVCILSLMCFFCIFSATAGTSLDFRIVSVEDSPAGDLALSMVDDSSIYELTHISKTLTLFLIIVFIILLLFTSIEVWMFITVLGCFFHLQEKAILKAQPLTMNNEIDRILTSKAPSRSRVGSKRDCFSSKLMKTNPSTRAETDC